MGTIKEYQRKIISLKNTRKITGSMKMISSIKLQRMSKLRGAATPFLTALRGLLTITGMPGCDTSIYLQGYKKPERIHYLIITSDRGMCGRFNINTIRTLLGQIAQDESAGMQVSVTCIGQKAYVFLKRHGVTLQQNYTGCVADPSWDSIEAIAGTLFDEFTSGVAHEIRIIHSRRISSFSEEPVVGRILPLPSGDNGDAAADDYLLEGSSERLLQTYARLMVQGLIYEAIIESGVAEHAARMSAMDNATNNCDRMTGKYVQLRNRARQAAITTELNEIVTGKEALES